MEMDVLSLCTAPPGSAVVGLSFIAAEHGDAAPAVLVTLQHHGVHLYDVLLRLPPPFSTRFSILRSIIIDRHPH